MRKSLSLFLWTTLMCGFASCSDDEKVTLLDIPTKLVNNKFAYQTLVYDGIEKDTINFVNFEVLNATAQSDGKIYTADMKLSFPTFLYNPINRQAFQLEYQVNAVSTEEYISFNGDCIHNTDFPRYSVEGVYRSMTYANTSIRDTLRVNLKRSSSPASFTGKTYELILDEDLFILDDFMDNMYGEYNASTTAKKGIPYYLNYLKDKTGAVSYRFTFKEDAHLVVEKKDAMTEQYITLENRFKYFPIDDNLMYIEMDWKTAVNLSKLLYAAPNIDQPDIYWFDYNLDFMDIYDLILCFRMHGNELRLAIGDKKGRNMRWALYQWIDYEEGKKYWTGNNNPFLELYATWEQMANSSDQLWWCLKEK